MAKRRTLKRRWLEEKAKREALEKNLELHRLNHAVRQVVREPIRMAISNSFHRKAIEAHGVEHFKKLMLEDLLKREFGTLSDEEYNQWLDIVGFEVEDRRILPHVTITLIFNILPR